VIETGKHNELTILRETSVGLFLGSDFEEDEDILLPNKYCPESYRIGDHISVFVYRDSEDRRIATTLRPKIFMREFALLQVTAVTEVGAFLDWGLEKDLLVPFREQRQKLEAGRWYVVYLDLDKETDRLYASNKIEKRLQNEDLTAEVGDGAELLIFRKTDIGFSVIINNKHKGLVFNNEIFTELNIGDQVKGYVKNIHADNKIDISLQPIGFANYSSANDELLHRALVESNGFLPYTDKSSPDEIYARFGISKKAFKKALGTLYKKRVIELTDKGFNLRSQVIE